MLARAYRPPCHVFSDMHEHGINIGDFYGPAFCNSFNCSA
jgi:hypothetical protein